MAKVKEDTKLTRADTRVEALKRLVMTLEHMPLSSLAKDLITKEWTKTYDRFNSLKVKHSKKADWEKAWKELSYDDLFKEYKTIEDHFKHLNIFSDKFYSTLNMRWNDLLNTFSPTANWYKD